MKTKPQPPANDIQGPVGIGEPHRDKSAQRYSEA